MKILSYLLLVDAIGEAWDRHDPFMLADLYRVANLPLDRPRAVPILVSPNAENARPSPNV